MIHFWGFKSNCEFSSTFRGSSSILMSLYFIGTILSSDFNMHNNISIKLKM